MKLNFKLWAMTAVALFAMNSCTQEEEIITGGEQKGTPVNFVMGIASTRTTTDYSDRTTEWKAGDAVGIFAYTQGETTNPVYTNAKYVLNADGTTWEAADDLNAIYADEVYDYYAYYPYQENVTDPTQISLSALTGQTTDDAYASSDVLAAGKATPTDVATTVSLTFKHVFAMVEVQVKGDLVAQQPTSVVLNNVQAGSTLDLTATNGPSATATGETTNVTMLNLNNAETTGTYAFRAVVPSQEIAAETQLVTINDVNAEGTDYSMKYNAKVTYEAGHYRQLVVKIATEKISLEIPATNMDLTPWESSEAIEGEGEEVVTPPQSLITVPFSGISTLNQITANNAFTTTGWYSLVASTSSTTYNIVDDTDGKNITVTYDGAASWYNNTLAYYDTNTNNTNNIDPNKTYRLSFSAKTDIETTGNNTSFWCYVKLPNVKTNDVTGFFLAKADITSAADVIALNTTCYNVQLSNDWAEYQCDFTFAYAGNASGIGGTGSTSSIEWNQVTDFAYYIGIAPRSVAGNYYVKDIKFEEVKE